MKIAIYQGFYNMHYCVLGYLIEYCLNNNFEFEIFAYEYLDWKIYYELVFNMKMTWVNPQLFDIELCDYVFLVNDDDFSFKQYIIDNYNFKIISIDHVVNEIRRDNLIHRVYLRYNSDYENNKWALACYKAIEINKKLTIINNSKKIKVVSIGEHNIMSMPSSNSLKSIFENFDEIEFHFVNRRIPFIYDTNNIVCHININTIKLFELLENADYVFFSLGEPQGRHHYGTINSSFQKALSYGCKIIMPAYWNNYLNLNSVLLYDPVIDKEDYKKLNLEKITKDEVYKVFDERDALIKHRDYTFNKIIQPKFEE